MLNGRTAPGADLMSTQAALSGTKPHDSIASVEVTIAVVLVYCVYWLFLRKGGLDAALLELKTLNWSWFVFEVGLPLGLPILFGLIVVAGAYILDVEDVPGLEIAVEELTPWTLCFFSLTVLSSALRRQYGKQFGVWTVVIGCNLLVVTLLAASFTIWRYRHWHLGFSAYSAAIFLTLSSIWMSHAKDAKSAT